MTAAFAPRDQFREPFFSVILTTYNRAALLKRALDSLIVQTETDWEAIIVDDGSTDNTETLIHSYLENDSRIKYVYQENAGYSLSKNTGIFLANGKFITFLDSDDEYLADHLETRKIILQRHPEIQFLYGGVKVAGNQYVPDRFNFKKIISLSECVVGGTFFISRPLAVSLNGFHDIPMGSDADFFERVKSLPGIIRETLIPTYLYHREHENSLTNILMKQEGFSDIYR
jgi:glycosyltransferase involved in cell wall biosynthesis